jgi:Peptidase family M1 domain
VEKIRDLALGIGLGAGGIAVLSLPLPPLASAAAPASASASASASAPAPAPAPDPAEPPAADGERPSSAAPAVASYTLEAKLDAAAHTISGKGTLDWTNTARTPANELYFHLYLNAFKNDRTLFLRSPFGAGRSGDHAKDWGYVDVTRLAIRELGGGDLWPKADQNSPGDPDDQTDIRVPLPSPALPGQTLTIEFEWSSKLPRIVERTGYVDDFHLVGQWFPKIARREPDGTWAHFAFHPHAEFYADFGHYTVTLDVPANMVVGATGKLVKDDVHEGRRTLRYEAEGVHDFAWTAWPDFQSRRESIDGVDVTLLYPPGNEANADTELGAIRYALPRFDRLYGHYPHPTLTLVHPPDAARNAGGMEYPTLITTGGPWYAAHSGTRLVEAVTVHELGHQWFQGMIATNEAAWPFLDEGINTFAELDAMHERWGNGSLVALGALRVDGAALRRADAVIAGHDEPVAQPAAAFSSFRGIGALVYDRTGTILETVGNVWGRDRLEHALGVYARRYRFRHPAPRDFLAVMRDELGDDAAQSLQSALYEEGWVDYAVTNLDCVRTETPAGVFDRSTGRETVERTLADAERAWSCRALVRRRGTLTFPIVVDLVLDDGSVERRNWDGREAWTAISYDGSRRVVAAIADPEYRITLDDELGNNARRTRRAGSERLLERGVYFAELALIGAGP